MKKPSVVLGALAVGSLALALTGCSTGYPDIAGVWEASDGTPNKTISDDGNCTNMFYDGGEMQQIAKPGMCQITGTAEGGGYTLKVAQTGSVVTYTAKFRNHDDTVELSQAGSTVVTLTRAPSVD